ncbi:MAG: DUF1501 domain-containing protein, partial [Bryobacteraceae bacterium]
MWTDRREFLRRSGLGFGALAFRAMAAPKPHFAAKARSVIFLFMHGGPSHVDTFDPKPALARYHGQPVPPSFGSADFQFTRIDKVPLLASRRTFRKRGQSGLEISDLFENVAQHADDLAVIRSCHHDGFTHTTGQHWMNNGWSRIGRPSVGSWIVYGLGSESENLPAYMVMLDGSLKAGPPLYGSGFLPANYQGTVLRSKGAPVLNASPPPGVSRERQREMLDLLAWNNERHLETRREDSDLAARIAAYELAFKMQTSAPELAGLEGESEATRRLYGLDDDGTAGFGRQCLLARRMVERGVRFVQVFSGGGDPGWDGHNQCDRNHLEMASKVDRPIAGLLADLKSRGLLE